MLTGLKSGPGEPCAALQKRPSSMWGGCKGRLSAGKSGHARARCRVPRSSLGPSHRKHDPRSQTALGIPLSRPRRCIWDDSYCLVKLGWAQIHLFSLPSGVLLQIGQLRGVRCGGGRCSQGSLPPNAETLVSFMGIRCLPIRSNTIWFEASTSRASVLGGRCLAQGLSFSI